jgi:cytochrome c-type biogenesis protein
MTSQLQTVLSLLGHQIVGLETSYREWLENQQIYRPSVLLILAFAGGLLSSLSPCILALLPVNLAYIGTQKITSRREAFVKAGLFVLGTATVLSLFGLFSSFAAAVLVGYRGFVNIVIGALIVLMGFSFAGFIHVPLPQATLSLPISGPYAVGVTFALVSSPCASPVLFSVLAAAATTGSTWLSALTMACYALGYTAVIFLASLFTGLVKRTKVLLVHSDWIVRLGSLILILAGAYYLVNGIYWLL